MRMPGRRPGATSRRGRRLGGRRPLIVAGLATAAAACLPGCMTLSWAPEPPRDAAVATAATETEAEAARRFDEPSIPVQAEFAVDLSSALRLAEAENPAIAAARQRVGEAAALLQQARVLMLPSLNMGTNYHLHRGELQRSSGAMINLRQQAFYIGGGAEAVAANPVQIPAVSILSPLTDAIFEPLAARQVVSTARADAVATANEVLLEVSQLFFELTATEGFLRVRRETADDGAEVARLTRAYADAGQGRDADAHRAATELDLIGVEVRKAEEEAAVASARLAHRLHLDQAVRLRPLGKDDRTTTLIDPTVPLPDLIRTAMANRPEVRARTAAIEAAERRVSRERCRPLLPTVFLGFGGGAFGGGGNQVGNGINDMGGRTDFDVAVYWTALNFGMGNRALIRRQVAARSVAEGERARAVAMVRAETAAAFAGVEASRRRLDVTTIRLESARKGFHEDLTRIRNTVSRPIEVVNSLQFLNDARIARIRAVADYNQAEYRLFVSLGSPPPILGPAGDPASAPIAPPPLPPLVGLESPESAAGHPFWGMTAFGKVDP